MTTSTAEAANAAAAPRVEQIGVEFIPDAERDSHPRNLFSVFAGVNLGWVCAIYGWLGVVFGLDFAGSLTANLVGTSARSWWCHWRWSARAPAPT